jgi:protocatechuate 3,4-dioxygenase beta subunit
MRAGVALILLAGALAAQTTDPESKGVIRGTVKDTAGLPVSGIIVSAILGAEPTSQFIANGVSIRSAGKTATSQTDRVGKYAFKDLDPGTYFLRTERDSDSSAYRPVKVDAGQEITLDIVLPAKPTVSGRVVDQNGDPMVRAQVYLLTPEYRAGVLRQVQAGLQFTKEDGTYSFDLGLEPNRRYYFFADYALPRNYPKDLPKVLQDDIKPVAVLTYYPSAIRMDSATPIILQPGEHREKVDIKIPTTPFYCVEGKIQGRADFTIQKTELIGVQMLRWKGSAGEEGKYHFCGLPPGQYRLSADTASTEFTISTSDLQHVDLLADPAHLHLQIDWEDPPGPKLDPANDATLHQFASQLGLGDDAPIDADLRPLAAWAASGNPAPRELVTALAARLGVAPDRAAEKLAAVADHLFPMPLLMDATLTSLTTGVPIRIPASGEIPPGDYSVEFHAFAKTVGYPKELTYNDVRLADGVLRIAPASAGTLHALMARDVSTIAVTAVDPEGKSIPYVTVVLIPESVASVPQLSRDSVHGMTDQNGRYISPPLVPGNYKVLATTQTIRFSVPEDLEKVPMVLFQAKDVEVAPKATAKVAVEPVAIF